MVLSALLCSSSVAWGQVDTNHHTATIAAWNLQGNFNPVTSARIKQIAQGIAWLDPDVLALCEIDPVSVMDDLVTELRALGVE